VAGSALTIIAFIKSQSVFNYTVLILYAISIGYLIYKLLTSARMFGIVANAKTGAKVDLAVVRVISETSGKLVKTSVSNAKGRYLIIVPKGYYKMLSSKSGLEQSENIKINARNNFNVSKIKILMSEIYTKTKPPVATNNVPPVMAAKRPFSDSSEIIENFSAQQENYRTPDLNNLGISHLVNDAEPRTENDEPKILKVPHEQEIKENKIVHPNWDLPNDKSPL
jgi:hypothetical protein